MFCLPLLRPWVRKKIYRDKSQRSWKVRVLEEWGNGNSMTQLDENATNSNTTQLGNNLILMSARNHYRNDQNWPRRKSWPLTLEVIRKFSTLTFLIIRNDQRFYLVNFFWFFCDKLISGCVMFKSSFRFRRVSSYCTCSNCLGKSEHPKMADMDLGENTHPGKVWI